MYNEFLVSLCNERIRKILLMHFYLIGADIEEVLVEYRMNDKHVIDDNTLKNHFNGLYEALSIKI
jgi:hypothetical protein